MQTSELGEPTVVERPAQPYAGVRALVTMSTMPSIADRIPEVIGRLAARGVQPAGPPFLKYNVIDMDRQLEVEAGIPVAGDVQPEGDLIVATLPAGRFVTAVHVGGPAGLLDATRQLLDWAAERGLVWDNHATAEGDAWGCRLENYLTDPRIEPDLTKWRTELAFRLTDPA